MVEIFPNVPEGTRKQAAFWFDMAIRQRDPHDTIRMINQYRNTCKSEEEKEFVDFYFMTRMEQMKNENNIN